MQTTAPAIIAPWNRVLADILSNVLTRVGGSLRNGRRRCSRTLAQFVTALLPITYLISRVPSIVFALEYGWRSQQERPGRLSRAIPEGDDQQ